MQNIKLLLATLIATLVLVFGVSWLAENWLAPAGQTDPYQKTATNEELLDSSLHVLGAGEGATYTIVEFSDYICPACGIVTPQLEALVRRYPDQVRLVYRHFPLQNVHPNAFRLAEIAEAADMQGKFWETNDFIFSNQANLNNRSEEESLQFVVDNAAKIGLNVDQLRASLDSGEPKTKVEEDLRQAEKLQLSFTPSVFMNGQLMPIDQIEQKITSELGK